MIFRILRKCGYNMAKKFLFHWIPSYSRRKIRRDCEQKVVVLVRDEVLNTFTSTFQMYVNGEGNPYVRKIATAPEYEGRGIGIELYKIGKDLLVYSSVFWGLQNEDILYLVNFFGRKEPDSTYEAIRKSKDKGVVVIEDLSLTLLSQGDGIGVGDYVIGSVRKW